MEPQQSTDDIFKALLRNDIETAKTFIKNSTDLNAKNERGIYVIPKKKKNPVVPIFPLLGGMPHVLIR